MERKTDRINNSGFTGQEDMHLIRNIVFDMGNVIIPFNPEVIISRENIENPADRKLIMNELFRSVEWAQMDLGILTEETAEPRIMKRIPDQLKSAVRNMLYNWAIPVREINGISDLVASLKKAGYSVYLLSNASAAQHRYWPLIPVSKQFDGKLVSCDVRVVKPMHEIYHLFTEKFGLVPEECIFIDDSAYNVAAAIACGWKGIVFHGDTNELIPRLHHNGISF